MADTRRALPAVTIHFVVERERFEPLTLNLLTSKRTLIIFRNIIDEFTITA